MNTPKIMLDARLAAIYDMVGKASLLADIGADHGYLGVRMLLDGKCPRVEFCEISELSLRKAYRTAKKYGVIDRAGFSLGDGAEAIKGDPDAVVIAGMGGETIAGIIQRGQGRFHDAKLILQPNVGARLVRQALETAGYAIVDEIVARAKGRHYVIIKAEKGCAKYTEEELIAGPVLRKKRDQDFLRFAAFKLRVAKSAYQGAMGKRPLAETQLLKEIVIWERILSGDVDRAKGI